MRAQDKNREISVGADDALAALPASDVDHQHLKTWPKYFEAVERGTKTFEIRRNDRPFTVGTKLVLHEYDPTKTPSLAASWSASLLT